MQRSRIHECKPPTNDPAVRRALEPSVTALKGADEAAGVRRWRTTWRPPSG